jgi:hypothetical protein
MFLISTDAHSFVSFPFIVNTPRSSPVNGRRPARMVKPASPSDGSTSSTGSSLNKDNTRKVFNIPTLLLPWVPEAIYSRSGDRFFKRQKRLNIQRK